MMSWPMRRSSVIVRRRRPQAQNFRAVLFRDHLRRQGIAQRLGHFAALLVQHEAVGQHALVRRVAARADAFQQRGLEPAAMLVGAFQIKIGRPLGQCGSMGFSTRKTWVEPEFEPDIQNVGDLLVIFGIAALAQEARRRRGEPGIGAFGLEGLPRCARRRPDRSAPRRFSSRQRSPAARPRRAGATAPSRAGLPPCAPMRFSPRGGYHLVSA